MDESKAIAATRRWIADIVIELNLCPFARRVFQEERIRYVVSAADEPKMLIHDLRRELKALAAAPLASVETTLLIHPSALLDFLDYNDFLDSAERQLTKLGLEGVVQIASFHPDYRFAETDAGAAENYTNRSPYPMLHLLREESITALGLAEEELLEIPTRNVATLRNLGSEELDEKLKAIKGTT